MASSLNHLLREENHSARCGLCHPKDFLKIFEIKQVRDDRVHRGRLLKRLDFYLINCCDFLDESLVSSISKNTITFCEEFCHSSKDRFYRLIDPIYHIFMVFIDQTSMSTVSRWRLQQSWINFVIRLLICVSVDLGEKMLKADFKVVFKRASLFSGDDLHLSLFTGYLKKHLYLQSTRGRHGSYKALNFIKSLYESKKNWGPLPEEIKLQSFKDYSTLLSTPLEAELSMVKYIDQAVEMLFPAGVKFIPGDCIPTSSANYLTSRKLGGNLGETGHGTRQLYGFSQSDYLSLVQYNICKELSEREGNGHQLYILEEPGKHRFITVGPCNSYTMLRPLQKFMLSRWKKFEHGTMVNDDNLIPFTIGTCLKEGYYYISGDYTSATDGLSQDLSLYCMLKILSNIDFSSSSYTALGFEDNIYKTLGSVLIEHDLGNIEKVRGQLMGHPLSFVLLCILNLATLLCTFSGNPPKQYLINGDDICFVGTRRDYIHWSLSAESVGLKINENKTYISDQFYMINSRLFSRYVEIDYMRFSLSNNSKLEHTDPNQIFEEVRKSTYGCKRLTQILFKNFDKSYPHLRVKMGKKTVKFKRNYFLPKYLGGLGISPIPEIEVKINQAQACLAYYLFQNPEKSLPFFSDRIDSHHLRELKKLICPPTFVETIGPIQLNNDYCYQFDKKIDLVARSHSYCFLPGNTHNVKLLINVVARALSKNRFKDRRQILNLRLRPTLNVCVPVIKPDLDIFPREIQDLIQGLSPCEGDLHQQKNACIVTPQDLYHEIDISLKLSRSRKKDFTEEVAAFSPYGLRSYRANRGQVSSYHGSYMYNYNLNDSTRTSWSISGIVNACIFRSDFFIKDINYKNNKSDEIYLCKLNANIEGRERYLRPFLRSSVSHAFTNTIINKVPLSKMKILKSCSFNNNVNY